MNEYTTERQAVLNDIATMNGIELADKWVEWSTCGPVPTVTVTDDTVRQWLADMDVSAATLAMRYMMEGIFVFDAAWLQEIASQFGGYIPTAVLDFVGTLPEGKRLPNGVGDNAQRLKTTDLIESAFHVQYGDGKSANTLVVKLNNYLAWSPSSGASADGMRNSTIRLNPADETRLIDILSESGITCKVTFGNGVLVKGKRVHILNSSESEG